MCNNYRLETDLAAIVAEFSELKISIALPEGIPNVPAHEDIKISDMAPIVRSPVDGDYAGELVNRRWSWPGPTGKPVYNFRSEARRFASGRCLILADGFYEFTTPIEGQKRKTKWLFTLAGHRWFGIAGLWRSHPEIGEAFTMLTTEPGPDIAPYHRRQIIPLSREQWADWLGYRVPEEDVLRPSLSGTLQIDRVFPVG